MNPKITRINPERLHVPPGYHHVTVIEAGRLAFLAGQCPLDRDGGIAEGMAAQVAQVVANASVALAAAGAGPEDVVRSTIYVVSDDGAVLADVWRATRLRDRCRVHDRQHPTRRGPTRLPRPADRTRPHRRLAVAG